MIVYRIIEKPLDQPGNWDNGYATQLSFSLQQKNTKGDYWETVKSFPDAQSASDYVKFVDNDATDLPDGFSVVEIYE